MEKTAQFSVESVDSLVQRFQANGLETINLGLYASGLPRH